MTYHSLVYKHKCRGSFDTKQKRLLERLDERIQQRMGPFSEVEQQCLQQKASLG